MTIPRAAAVLAAIVLALHLPFLPASLEDLDSINFALGLREFDVAQHQPHPPGYPVYIAIGKIVRWFIPNEAHVLAVVSVVSAAAAVLAVMLLLSAWTIPGRTARGETEASRNSQRTAEPGAWLALGGTLLAVTSPLFWMTAVRPLSDMLGLAVAVSAQALTVRASSAQALGGAALVAALGVGVRSQVVWLTVPLLMLAVWMQPTGTRLRAGVTTLAAFLVGVLMWAVPLVVLSGGLAVYVRALASQGGEDFTGVAMLATQPSPRLLMTALYSTWLAPWGAWPVGVTVLIATTVGLARAIRTFPRVVAWVFVAFGPYAIFHLVFQETVTTRYALPLVIPVGFFAAVGLAGLPRRAGGALLVLLALVSVVRTQPAVRAYARMPAPAFRVLDSMASMATTAEPAMLAMHRRQDLDMRRALTWNKDRVPPLRGRLAAPPKKEWLELVKYWNDGGRAPVWFLADPPRSDLRLIDPHALQKVQEYRWPFDASTLLGGVRPNVMDFYRIEAPGWYVGEGWALTPESAGVAADEGKGPGRAPIRAWVRRRSEAATLMFGGRKMTGAEATSLVVSMDGRPLWEGSVPPGFFLHFVPLGPGALAGAGDYAEVTIASGTDEVALEQFDVQSADVPMFGYGDGWQELEYNPSSGRLWRWSGEKASIRAISARRPLLLQLQGEFETSALSAHVIVKAAGRTLAEQDVPRQFTLDVMVPADVVQEGGETVLTVETDQWYVPADTNWRPSQDRRHLGLRVLESSLKPAP